MLNLQRLKLIVAKPRPLADSAACALPIDVAASDWDVLFNAVKDRLRLIADERQTAALEPREDLQRARSGVLECAAALDHLHTMLRQELALRDQLEVDVREAHAALEQARTELQGTQAREQQARHRASHDALTSLPNGGYFHDRLQEALTATTRPPVIAVMYFDLDGFKPINDAHGRDVGDALLRIVAARLRGALRVEDVLSRLGGDEFACLLAEMCELESLERLARKLFDTVSAPLQIGKLSFNVRPSIGIAVSQTGGASAEQLLRNADAAMYHAKRQGTGHAFFDRQGGA